jgi:hypothetical protein
MNVTAQNVSSPPHLVVLPSTQENLWTCVKKKVIFLSDLNVPVNTLMLQKTDYFLQI